MRSTKFVASLGVLALALVGCANGTNEPEAAEPSSSTPVVDHCTDPLAGNPSEVNAQELAFCQAEALGKIAGWVQEDTIDDRLSSLSRVNIDPLAVEIQSFNDSGGGGPRAILIRGNTFVQRNGKWVQATTESDDETMAYQATMPMRFEALLNPNIRAAGTNPNLTYTVIGHETVNGEPVTVLSLEIDSEAGDTRESLVYIREDYVVVRTESRFRVNGADQTRATELTTIDEPQDIINPRFENDDDSGMSSERSVTEPDAEDMADN